MSFENKHCAITTRLVYVVCNINELTGYNLIGTLWQFDASLNKKKLLHTWSVVKTSKLRCLKRLGWLVFFFRTGNMNFANVVPFAWKGTIPKVGSKSWRQIVKAHMPLASRDLEGQSYDAWRKESVLSRRLVIKFVLLQLASPWSNYDGPSWFFRKSEEAYKLFLFCFRYQSWALMEIDKTRLTTNLSYSGLLIPFEREQWLQNSTSFLLGQWPLMVTTDTNFSSNRCSFRHFTLRGSQFGPLLFDRL